MRYPALRFQMDTAKMSQKDIARALGRSEGYVSLVMLGKQDFRLNEVWKIMDLLSIDPSEFQNYFPPKEKDDELMGKVKIDYETLTKAIISERLTTSDLADRVGIETTSIKSALNRIKKGYVVTSGTLYKLADAVRVDPISLVKEIEL